MHRDTGYRGAVSHPDRPRQRRPLKRHRHPGRVAQVCRRHRLQPEAHVGHGTRQRPLDRHHRHPRRALLGSTRVEIGNSTDRWAQAIDAGAIGRIAHRACDVVAMRDRPHARGDRRRRAAAGAAGGVVARPGVERAAMQVVVGEPAKRESRCVGTAEDHRTGAPQVGDDRAVVGRDRIAQRHEAVGGRAAALVDVDLGRHRHAVQYAERVTPGDC